MTQPFRIEPIAPAEAYQTYSLKRIPGVHTRPARCEEVDCLAYQQGWLTKIDISTDLGQRQAAYIRTKSGRAFTTWQDDTLITFTFYPGQQCFAQHQLALERDPLFLVRGGDHRGNPTGMQRRHTRGEDWVEDMTEHLGKVQQDKERG